MTTQLIAQLAILLIAGGATAVGWIMLGDPDSTARGWIARYLAELEHSSRFLLLKRTGAQIMRWQLIFAGVFLGSAIAVNPVFLYLAILALVAPPVVLRRRVIKRREQLETQLDGWLLLLANMLKATGSLADAVRATVPLSPKPVSQEIDLVVKELELGSPLDDALRSMATRINSPLVSAAITGLLVGRRTGGDMPKLLEQSAASLREIARLEGVVRSKTAQAKMQFWVMALFPPLIYWALLALDPHFFDPLTGFVGAVIYGVGFSLWLGGVVLAWKILDVDV